MNHFSSIFTNSCVRVPRDPVTKMPKTAYERKLKQQTSIDSSSTRSDIMPDLDAEKLKEFYRSIPDYKDIHHLDREEFYTTLKLLRDKKNKIFSQTITNIDVYEKEYEANLGTHTKTNYSTMKFDKNVEGKRHKLPLYTSNLSVNCNDNINISNSLMTNKIRSNKNNEYKDKKVNITEVDIKDDQSDCYLKTNKTAEESLIKEEVKPKRNYSACSISWNDKVDEVDTKFVNFFESHNSDDAYDIKYQNKSRSAPTSPVRGKRALSPCLRKKKTITVPKPFKMTERDEDERTVNRLRSLQKSLSDDMLHRKCERKQFRARPVPIESRIPLYEKILEDQAMRRAITKINSEAELRAQMKPFSFTKREENCSRVTSASCERAAHVIPKKKKKRFRARPVPKNLFSNYIYDKMREDDFFRNMNRRIRAEELLRRSALPSGMAARDSRLSTPAAHSDLPTDPSPVAHSVTPIERPRTRSPTKDKKRETNISRQDFITTSPQPFTFNTANRAAKKMLEASKRLYQNEPKSPTIGIDSERGVTSALELREHSAGRSNLAALLRVENVKRRFEMEASRRLSEQRRRAELRMRDRLLRSKPAWHLVKNDHEEDIAMRLQTRRDEERMRKEEFLHEMELMYGRVRQQPLLFERYYAPRSLSAPGDSNHYTTKRVTKKTRKSNKSNNHYNTPNISRKVSINETPETFNDAMSEYLTRIENDKLYSDSEFVTDSLV